MANYFGNALNNVRGMGSSNDNMFGFAGNDTLNGGAGNDFIHGNEGIDTLIGGLGNDVLFGGDGNDSLDGGAGNDVIYASGGNDYILGGTGLDVLMGRSGNDRFDFNSVSDSPVGANRDIILDFEGRGALAGDVVDLSTIDANVIAAGNQAFATSQLSYSGGVLTANVHGGADLQVLLIGSPPLDVVGPTNDLML